MFKLYCAYCLSAIDSKDHHLCESCLSKLNQMLSDTIKALYPCPKVKVIYKKRYGKY